MNKFPDFFRMRTFIHSTHMKLVHFEVISSCWIALFVPFQQLLEGFIEVLLCECVNDLRHSLFLLLISLITTASELRELTKVTGSKVWIIGRVRKMSCSPSWSNCLWQGWSCGLVQCPGRNATDPIWRMLASFDGISSWTPLKLQHSIPCRMSVQWEPSASRSFQCCQKKRDHQSLWVDLLCLAFLGLGEPECFHWELCLLVYGS